jgi:hypothetical protein
MDASRVIIGQVFSLIAKLPLMSRIFKEMNVGRRSIIFQMAGALDLGKSLLKRSVFVVHCICG